MTKFKFFVDWAGTKVQAEVEAQDAQTAEEKAKAFAKITGSKFLGMIR